MAALTGPINTAALPRLAWQEKVAAEAGWALPRTMFALGTALYGTKVALEAGEGQGYGNCFEQKRAERMERPLAQDAVEAFRDAIRAEKRLDFDMPVREVRMTAEGVPLLSTPEGLFQVETPAWRKLANELATGLGTYGVTAIENGAKRLIAGDFNFWAKHEGSAEKEVKLRTREVDGVRRVWAVVSPTYGKFDADKIAQAIGEAAAPGSRMIVQYDGYEALFDVSSVTDIELANEVGVGEVFFAGTRAGCNDDGSGSFYASAFLERGVCRNFGSVTTTQEAGSRVHRGTEDAMREGVLTIYNNAEKKISAYTTAWAAAAQDKIFDGPDDARSKLFKLIVERGLVKVAGETRQTVFNNVWAAHQKEPGSSRQSLVNALTRGAHEGRWQGSKWTAREVENASQAFVYNRVAFAA